jgi:hypothetical protein
VLVENNPHRDMDADPATASVLTPFGVHWEALLHAGTGQRFYAGFWDGWQWSPWRGQTLAGGTLFGKQIALVPPGRFEHEMRRWDVERLFVWSAPSVAYLEQLPRIERTWTDGRWHEFALTRAPMPDPAIVASLTSTGRLGATIDVEAAQGAEVVVRTNHFPAWQLRSGGSDVPHFARDGQLAFRAPAAGRQQLELVYPRRAWLSLLAMVVWIAALAAPIRTAIRERRPANGA